MVLFCALACITCVTVAQPNERRFPIYVSDAHSGRNLPGIKRKTTNKVCYYCGPLPTQNPEQQVQLFGVQACGALLFFGLWARELIWLGMVRENWCSPFFEYSWRVLSMISPPSHSIPICYLNHNWGGTNRFREDGRSSPKVNSTRIITYRPGAHQVPTRTNNINNLGLSKRIALASTQHLLVLLFGRPEMNMTHALFLPTLQSTNQQ